MYLETAGNASSLQWSRISSLRVHPVVQLLPVETLRTVSALISCKKAGIFDASSSTYVPTLASYKL